MSFPDSRWLYLTRRLYLTLKEVGHWWLPHIRNYPKPGTVVIDCSLSQFWRALKVHLVDRFAWFKKPVILILSSPFTFDRFWKDLGHLNTLELAPTLALKSSITSQETGIFPYFIGTLVQISINTGNKNSCLLWDLWKFGTCFTP